LFCATGRFSIIGKALAALWQEDQTSETQKDTAFALNVSAFWMFS
jgi:hypothetical protein